MEKPYRSLLQKLHTRLRATTLLAHIPLFIRQTLQKAIPTEINISALFEQETLSQSPTLDAVQQRNEYDTSSTDSLLRPGPFTTVILDMQFSSDSSSYCPSKHRDLPIANDSIDTSSHSTVSIKKYLAFQQQKQYQITTNATSDSTIGSDSTATRRRYDTSADSPHL